MEHLEIFELAVLVVTIVVAVIFLRPKSTAAASDRNGEPGFGTVGWQQRIVNGAGLTMNYLFVWFAMLLAGITLALVILELFAVPWWAGLLAALLFPYILWSLLTSVAHRRAVRFEEKLIDAVDLMISLLQSGETPLNALRGVAENGEEPVRSQFNLLVQRLDFGMEIYRALRPIIRGYDSEGLRLFANTLAVKFTLGGDLSPMLESLNQVLRDRYRYRVQVSSQMSGPRLASLAIAASPYVILAFYAFRKPDWIDRIFNSTAGTALFVGAVIVQILGFVWLGRLARSES